MKPRILIVNTGGNVSGAERSLLLMVKYLRSEYEIVVACPAGGALWDALTSEGINCFRLPAPTPKSWLSLSGFLYWVSTGSCLMKIVLKTWPDIVHANSLYGGMIVLPAVVMLRRRLVMHVRDLVNLGLLARLCCLFSRKVIAISHAVEKALIRQKAKPWKIFVVYNGTDEISQEAPRKQVISSDPTYLNGKVQFVFANIGQFVPWKKQLVFLEAASRIVGKIPEAEFMLVGDDVHGRDSEYKNSIRDYVENSKIAGKVSFVGWQEDMQEIWPKIDCLVHTAAKEPFGRVIIEAMAHKIPVIAVNACGPSEIIEDGKTGILVRGDDIDGFSEAMLRIALNPELAEKLGAAGYEHVAINFTANKTAKRISNIYQEILAA